MYIYFSLLPANRHIRMRRYDSIQFWIWYHRPLSRRLDRCDRVIQNESRYPFGGNVTMRITSLTRKFRNGERNLYCDVVHITTKWVSSLTLDCNGVFAIKAYKGRRRRRRYIYIYIGQWAEPEECVRHAFSSDYIVTSHPVQTLWIRSINARAIIRLIHESAISRGCLVVVSILTDRECNCCFFFISTKFNGLIFNIIVIWYIT